MQQIEGKNGGISRKRDDENKNTAVAREVIIAPVSGDALLFPLLSRSRWGEV